MKEMFCQETDSQAALLRSRMSDFYQTTSDYDAFHEENWKPEFWEPVRSVIERFVRQTGACTVLEFGAGRTGFAKFLGPLRPSVQYHVQDVTRTNAEYLGWQADRVHLVPLKDVHEGYDVIFSTFVWEHLTEPRATLEHLLSLATDRGVLFLASPRYDFPGYLSPSIRHLPRARRAIVALWLCARRAASRLGGRADFLLHADPAVFHRPWTRDADAIHWVSRWDLVRALPGGWAVRDIRLPTHGALHWFWSRFLLMFVMISRSGGAAGSVSRK